MDFSIQKQRLLSLETYLDELVYGLFRLVGQSNRSMSDEAIRASKYLKWKKNNAQPERFTSVYELIKQGEFSSQTFDREDFLNICSSFHLIVYDFGASLDKYNAVESEVRDHFRTGAIVDFPCIAPSYCDAFHDIADREYHSALGYADHEIMKRYKERRVAAEAETSEYISTLNPDEAREYLKSAAYGAFDEMEEMMLEVIEPFADYDGCRESWMARFCQWGEQCVRDNQALINDDHYLSRIRSLYQGELSKARLTIDLRATHKLDESSMQKQLLALQSNGDLKTLASPNSETPDSNLTVHNQDNSKKFGKKLPENSRLAALVNYLEKYPPGPRKLRATVRKFCLKKRIPMDQVETLIRGFNRHRKNETSRTGSRQV